MADELYSSKSDGIVKDISILYVEDDEEINGQLSVFLRRRVKMLFSASNAQEGLELFSIHTPDIVITDINMPYMDGIQMVRQIKKIRQDTKIIVTTAFNDEEYFIRAIDAKVDSFIKKPIDLYKLIEAIAKNAIDAIHKRELDEKSKLIDLILNQSVGDSVIAIDVNGNVIFMNPTAQYIIGCLVEQAYGRPLSEMFTIKSDYDDETLPLKSLIQDNVVDLTNHKIVIPGQQILTIYGYTSPIKDHDNIFIGVAVIFQDLNKLKQTQERLSYQLERFISVLIHDLKTPLIAISGYARRFLLGKAKSDEEKMNVINNIKDISEHLLNTIEDTSSLLKEKAELKTFIPRHLQFDKILTMAIINCLPAMESRGLNLTLNNQESVQLSDIRQITLAGDQRQLINMIENLLSNAIKYAKSSIWLSYDREGASVRLTVTDDGPGIDDGCIDKIFDPYYQIPGSVKGTGLGLYSVKKVVENHKGSISVRSHINVGSTFEVTLPCNP
ncbi:multi-sensor signal transduction histidine kinase [Candidatus Magnetobacterium bavaricum]|uniref:histidine kinase n=1 Tax=Candidatus Magnetobacterium bavaricum TaxID=29290 RepID=A0A0F3GLL1_9BACT|nr:multi-sensor signal transduction histidine kinase [Candidatus Magnetobacterium bavaricum]